METNTTKNGWSGLTIWEALSQPFYRHITTSIEFDVFFEDLKERSDPQQRLCLKVEYGEPGKPFSQIVIGIYEIGWVVIDQNVVDEKSRAEFVQVLFRAPLLLEEAWITYLQLQRWGDLKGWGNCQLNFFCLQTLKKVFEVEKNLDGNISLNGLVPFGHQQGLGAKHVLSEFNRLREMLLGAGNRELFSQQNIILEQLGVKSEVPA